MLANIATHFCSTLLAGYRIVLSLMSVELKEHATVFFWFTTAKWAR
jgi:hypothetical protein